MDISRLKVGILHSLIGKNDGVSIVIDQTIKTMVKKMEIPLGNIYYLAGHSPPRLNTTLDEVFWHRSEDNRYILENYDKRPPKGYEERILTAAKHAKELIAQFVEENGLDLIIIHNSCHPSNFIYAVAAGMYFEERRKDGVMLPRYLLWWHDSHFERKRFAKNNKVIKKYLDYIPGSNVDGIVFINTEQPEFGKKYLESLNREDIEQYFDRKTCIIPNTCDIPWHWQTALENNLPLVPPEDQYNKSFYKEIGLLDELEERGFGIHDAVVLLQHTRIVERKRIDIAIDYAIQMSERFTKDKQKKCIVLLISGHSGDEHDSHRTFLEDYFEKQLKKHPKIKKSVLLMFGESHILPNREVLVNRKYYAFADIPSIVAASGGMGTYFSEVEGFGNNLLEMMALGLPVVLNRYNIYKTDLEPLGFEVAAVDDCKITPEVVEKGYQYLTNPEVRRDAIQHNLEVLSSKLSHDLMASMLTPLIQNLFKYR
jgi:glycosyltransferase involved in cell wall biosynthesis